MSSDSPTLSTNMHTYNLLFCQRMLVQIRLQMNLFDPNFEWGLLQ